MNAIEVSDRPLEKPKPKNIVPQLGLVCITKNSEVRFRTITRSHYLKLSAPQRKAKLEEIYSHNLNRLNTALTFAQSHSLKLYRMPSSLFPLSDLEDQIGATILKARSADFAKIGQRATFLGIRMVLHPDQFVVLSSDKPDVVANSIKILEQHAYILDLLGLDKSPWSLINIHGGKSDRADQLVEVISQLPENIKNRLTLENDEHAYSASQILQICQRGNIPMVFDAHHHICYEKLHSYDHPSVAEIFYAARQTWTDPQSQLVHISNGQQAFNDRKHSNMITHMPQVYRQAPWIEVEAKYKEEAINHLRSWWLMRK